MRPLAAEVLCQVEGGRIGQAVALGEAEGVVEKGGTIGGGQSILWTWRIGYIKISVLIAY
jgi:hypothetical protein